MVAAAVLFVLLCAINLLVCSLRAATFLAANSLWCANERRLRSPPDSTGGERAAAAGGARPLRNQIRVLCGTVRN